MRLYSLLAVSALLTVPFAAYADTITQTFSVSGNTSAQQRNDLYGIASSSFAGFDPAKGTLNSFSVNFSGTATNGGSGLDLFSLISTPDSPISVFSGITTSGTRFGAGSFNISASGTDGIGPDVARFVGVSSQALLLEFNAPTTNLSVTNGTITYNYTMPSAPVAATPEPSSIALLGTGVLGVAGVLRRRFA